MSFTRDIALWQRRIVESPEAQWRRALLFDVLSVRVEQRILDIGCGGGYLVRELALAVGDSGRATGIDLSADQLEAARARCEGLAAADFVECDATDLPFEDGMFDAIASNHTMEYIANTARALHEARRVLKRGGKAVVSSALWDHFRYYGADPELTEQMLDRFRAHCPHQSLPHELPARMTQAGFGVVTQQTAAALNNAFSPNTYGYWAAKIVSAFALANGATEDDATRWLDQLAAADREGRYGFVSMPVITVATAL